MVAGVVLQTVPHPHTKDTAVEPSSHWLGTTNSAPRE